MQQALEALERADKDDFWREQRDAITALKAALEQPEQEPFAFCYVKKGRSVDILTFDDAPSDAVEGTLFPLYTTPPAAQPENGDIRALKYRIHELEGEVIGYKRMIEEAALKKLADLGQEIEQGPTCPECKAAVLYECVACSSNNYPPKPEQALSRVDEPKVTHESAHSRAINAAHKLMLRKTCERCGAELMSDMTNTCYQCNQD
jgi:hypothetical protein